MLSRRDLLRTAAIASGVAAAGCDVSDNKGLPAPLPQSQTPAPQVSAEPSRPPLPAEVVNGPRDKPNVALTFHGQGDATIVKQILHELSLGQAPATVLAVGSWLAAQPGPAKLVLDAGHELGNHTQNHLAISAMKPAQALAEIKSCADELKKLTGSIGKWFRPSQTQYSNELIRAQATAAGYETCLSYDLDSLDYQDPGAKAVVRNVLSGVKNGSIISLHFGHTGTIAAIAGILDGLREKALKPVTMTEMMN